MEIERRLYMKLWIDDVRVPPSDEWLAVHSVNQAKIVISYYERQMSDDSILISLDHDAGDFVNDGGDYIKLLDWLEEKNIVDSGYFFHIHSQNPVGVENMRRIIKNNDWKEVGTI